MSPSQGGQCDLEAASAPSYPRIHIIPGQVQIKQLYAPFVVPQDDVSQGCLAAG